MNTPSKLVIIGLVLVAGVTAVALKGKKPDASPVAEATGQSEKLPRLLDLGADKCIPCKAMAPILEELKKEYAGRMTVEFIDVWKNPEAGKAHNIEMIPTQIFYDAEGKELFRHTGFFGKQDILDKWRDLGIRFAEAGSAASITREKPVAADTRPKESVCYMCDGDVNPGTRSVVKGASEQRVLCSPHCYFIFFSSLVGPDTAAEEAKVYVTDWSSRQLVAASGASYLYGMATDGRPTIKAFASAAAAAAEQKTSPGTVLNWELLRNKELAVRCNFCDRAVYPEDACAVRFGSTRGYGCCTHCSMGVAARLKQDIEVEAKDGFSGEIIRVVTLDGQVASLVPPSAVAWFGQKPGADGKWVSAGCFKQGFFVNQANLQKWLEARPAMTGRQITIAQALKDKMSLSPEQIAKACKLGECK